MKKLFVVLLLLTLNISLASNTILAIVNNKVITTESFQNQLNIANTFDQKMELLSHRLIYRYKLTWSKNLALNHRMKKLTEH